MKEGELNNSTVEESSVVQKGGNRNVRRKIKVYNLDMIISVGYRVKSKRGIAFRKWANRILKDYMLKGYAVNEKRLEALNKTVEIQSQMISTLIEADDSEVFEVVSKYTEALTLLDEYDHQCLNRPEGNETVYRLSYEECRKLIDSMAFDSDVFGLEKEEGKLKGIYSFIFRYIQFLMISATNSMKIFASAEDNKNGRFLGQFNAFLSCIVGIYQEVKKDSTGHEDLARRNSTMDKAEEAR